MAPGDIAIQLVLAIQRPRVDRTFAWPPRISHRDVTRGFEGLTRRVGVYQGTTRVGARDVSVFVIFGRSRPSDQQLRRADAELRRARLT
jgi:hypothetical protein